ncbi:hypothetical protein E8E12_007750 [Didymella heteroderae]|uniref:Rhodopsin domain-containing protein n=1 Tax=Didymella heteroderae TaxID=1769908 RepID=A0A9P4WVV9_9PLEO|nr:hypothetical protein E8E12_007750 [Didymella heteroderae]
MHCCRAIKRRWKADDFMSLVVGVFMVGALGLWQQAFSMGCAGIPEPNSCSYLNPSGNVLTWFFVTSIIYDAVLHFIIRAAFSTFYWSISVQSNFRFWIGLGLGSDVMLLIFNILVIVFRCKPVTANFRPKERLTAQCMDSGFTVFTPAALAQNSLLNLYVLVLPMPIFYRVQVPFRRKMHICCMFTIGGAAVALGFIRMHSLQIISSGTDTSRAVGETMIVGALGMSLAAVAHNLPSLQVFWKHVSKNRSKGKVTSQPPFNTRIRKLPSASATSLGYSTLVLYIDGSDDVSDDFLVASDIDGNVVFPVVCKYSQDHPTRIFVVSDLESGIATLKCSSVDEQYEKDPIEFEFDESNFNENGEFVEIITIGEVESAVSNLPEDFFDV